MGEIVSRTLHQIPTEIFRVRITWRFTREDIDVERTTDLGPYLSGGTAQACVTRELPNYSAPSGKRGRFEIFRHRLSGEWEVVK